jgi:hypothetical protein
LRGIIFNRNEAFGLSREAILDVKTILTGPLTTPINFVEIEQSFE